MKFSMRFVNKMHAINRVTNSRNVEFLRAECLRCFFKLKASVAYAKLPLSRKMDDM